MTRVGTLVRRHFEPLLLAAQVLVDLAVILLACFLGFHLGEELAGGYGARKPPPEVFLQLSALIAVVCLLSFRAFGMYRPVPMWTQQTGARGRRWQRYRRSVCRVL